MRLSFSEALQREIPENYQGVEQCDIINQWLTHHPDQESECRDLLKLILMQAKDLSASDVDLGAPGCNNKIWMRIYGNKKPVEDLGVFSCTETNSLILSWLTPS